MAITTGTSPSATIKNGLGVYTINPKAEWKTVCTNSNATAQTAAELLAPLTAGITSEVVEIPIPDWAWSVILRQGCNASGVTVGTQAIVRVYVHDRARTRTMRIDNVDNGATGITLELNSTLANNLSDGTYVTGDPVSLTGIGLVCGATLCVLRSTASAHTGGADKPFIEAMFLPRI